MDYHRQSEKSEAAWMLFLLASGIALMTVLCRCPDDGKKHDQEPKHKTVLETNVVTRGT